MKTLLNFLKQKKTGKAQLLFWLAIATTLLLIIAQATISVNIFWLLLLIGYFAIATLILESKNAADKDSPQSPCSPSNPLNETT